MTLRTDRLELVIDQQSVRRIQLLRAGKVVSVVVIGRATPSEAVNDEDTSEADGGDRRGGLGDA
ncbi:Uncharacterised protein [Chlamydia trachomatis]|nr:Uncharacterised protein [Chlamydia trachomatis]